MFKHILFPVDLARPDSWNEALPAVQSLARCYSSEVTICSIATDAEAVETGDWLPNSFRERLLQKHAELDEIAAGMRGSLEVNVEVGTGSVDRGILEVAERVGADLIVLPSYHHTLLDRLLSTHSGGLARRARCSVLVLR